MKITNYAKNVWKENNMNLLSIIILIYLGYCSYTDIKRKEIKVLPTITICSISIITCLILVLTNRLEPKSFFLSFIPGVSLIFISFVTKESIGYGDSIILGLCSISTSLKSGIVIILISFICSALYSLFLLIKGKSGKESIPFVPFIFTGYILYITQGGSL